MPSPFPGVDPFVESQRSADFHGRFLFILCDMLVVRLRPAYEVLAESRVYIEYHPDRDDHILVPDLTVARRKGTKPLSTSSTSAVATLEPDTILVPAPEEVEERYLVIRSLPSHEVVTTTELLSPANKHPGSDGRNQYLQKRAALFRSLTNLVELDLLRGGERPPALTPLSSEGYYAVVSRPSDLPRASAYHWGVRDRLPCIPIPLAPGDTEVAIDLQDAFNLAYDRGGYDYGLQYTRPTLPPLLEEDTAWAQAILAREAAGG